MEEIINLTGAIENLQNKPLKGCLEAVLIVIAFYILSMIVSYLIIKLFNFKQSKKEVKENIFYLPIKGFIIITGFYIAVLPLKEAFGISDQIMLTISKIYKIIVTVVIANTFAKSVTKKMSFIKKIQNNENINLDIDEGQSKMIARLLKGIIYIIAGFIIFAELGFDLNGLAAGLGLGSLVVTLALQDTIKNLFGGIVVYTDKIYKLGDYIKIGEAEGIVEDISLRSTKIKTEDNTIIQIPNSLISSQEVENISKKNQRRYMINIEIVLDTKLSQIDSLKNEIERMLLNHERVIDNSINIHFNKVESSGFNIIVICYLKMDKQVEFLDLQEEFNKLIMSIVEKQGIELAYDTKTIEIKKA